MQEFNIILGGTIDINSVNKSIETIRTQIQPLKINVELNLDSVNKQIDGLNLKIQESLQKLNTGKMGVGTGASLGGSALISESTTDKAVSKIHIESVKTQEALGKTKEIITTTVNELNAEGNAQDRILEKTTKISTNYKEIARAQDAEIKAQEAVSNAITQTLNNRAKENELLEKRQSAAINKNLENQYKAQQNEQQKVLTQSQNITNQAELFRKKIDGIVLSEKDRSNVLERIKQIESSTDMSYEQKIQAIKTLNIETSQYSAAQRKLEAETKSVDATNQRLASTYENLKARIQNLGQANTISKEAVSDFSKKLEEVNKIKDPTQRANAFKQLGTSISDSKKQVMGLGEQLKIAYSKFANQIATL